MIALGRWPPVAVQFPVSTHSRRMRRAGIEQFSIAAYAAFWNLQAI